MSTQEGNLRPITQTTQVPNGISINIARHMPSSAKRLLTNQNNRTNYDGDTSFSRELYRPESTRPENQSPLKSGKRAASVASRGKQDQQQLEQPYNRRAKLLREKKDQIKLQERENSFKRNEKRTESVNKMYNRPAEGTKGLFDFYSNANRSNPQISPMSNRFNQSAFDFNERLISHPGYAEQPSAVLIKIATPIRQKMFMPGNSQNNKSEIIGTGENGQSHQEAIEKAKQLLSDQQHPVIVSGYSRENIHKNKRNDNRVNTVEKMPSTFGITSPQHKSKRIELFNLNEGQNIAKTQRDAQIEQMRQKNQQILNDARNGPGMSNTGKVTLNPNNKHGVVLSHLGSEAATYHTRNHNTANQYYAAIPQSMTAVGTPSKNANLSLRQILSTHKHSQRSGNNINIRTSQSMQRSLVEPSDIVKPSIPHSRGNSYHQLTKQNSRLNTGVNTTYLAKQTEPELPCSAFFQNEGNFEKGPNAAPFIEKLKQNDLTDPSQFSMFNSPQAQQNQTYQLENKEHRLKELWDQATQEVLMSYNNDVKNPKKPKKAHPSNAQGEFGDSKQGFVTNGQNAYRQARSPQNFAREDLRIYQIPSNRSSNHIIQKKQYGLRGNDQLNQSQHSQLTDREVYTSPQFSVVATQQKQRDQSQNRCSIRSLSRQDVDEDIPDDPLELPPNKKQKKQKSPRDNSPWTKGESIIVTEKERQERETGLSIKGQISDTYYKVQAKQSGTCTPNAQSKLNLVSTFNSKTQLEQQQRNQSLKQSEVNIAEQNEPGTPRVPETFTPQKKIDRHSFINSGHMATQPHQTSQIITMTCTSAFESDAGSILGLREGARERRMMMTNSSNPEIKKQPSQRGDSFVRDGYEITIEEIYHVNGRKKKKVKKRKLTKQQLKDQEKLLDQSKNEATMKQTMQRINLEDELRAIADMSAQTNYLEARQKLQSQFNPTQKITSANSMNLLPNQMLAIKQKPLDLVQPHPQKTRPVIQLTMNSAADIKLKGDASFRMDGVKGPTKKAKHIPVVPRKLVVRREVDLDISNSQLQHSITTLTSKGSNTRNLLEASRLNSSHVNNKRQQQISDLPQKRLNRQNQRLDKHRSLEVTHEKNTVGLEEKKGRLTSAVQQEEKKNRRNLALQQALERMPQDKQGAEERKQAIEEKKMAQKKPIDTQNMEEKKSQRNNKLRERAIEQNSRELFSKQSNQAFMSSRSANFRDPDLMLVTSSRLVTLREVSNQHFEGVQQFILHRMIFQKKFPDLLKVFKTTELTAQHLNEKDHRGNTPLILAGKLSIDDDEYLKCINFLCKQKADSKIRDSNGWSLMDEAIDQGNSRLMGIAFNWNNIRKKEKIQRNKMRIIERLKGIPDFYCEIHWECQSSWIPFLSRIAPSDDFQIWKVGAYIRLDFSLVGFQKLQNKRRRMTLLFRDPDEADDEYKDIDTLMVNKDRKIIVNPLEDLDDEEKLAVLTDIMNADPVQNELNITRQEWSEVHNFFGGIVSEVVNDYNCQRHKVTVEAQVRSKKKIKQKFGHNYDSYFEGAEDYETGKLAADTNTFKVAKDVTKVIESQLWLSNEFPLQFKQFMEVLDTLAISGQASMQKIHEFLQNDCLQEVANRVGFPVKIQIPVGMSVKALVTFGKFKYLEPEDKEAFIKETFAVPDYCKMVSRKEGMKTMTSKKKRLAVANFAT